MQRLFTIFPNSWPGFGLLILRLAACQSLWSRGVPGLHPEVPRSPLLDAAVVCDVCSLALGLLTPLGALGQVALELMDFLRQPALASLYLSRGALGLSLLMLGPGAWSLDAMCFGRRRIDVDSDPSTD